ncbi:hypothetical protein [Acinetobacter ursingii]|uniref:hypothetical protein n=1 Tax=Acinetobacter ursingii TaxID=108980 RepID=UPI00124FF83D|nr:hypothetical protein [Acinetobacter ursingii]MCU4351977.1 hypothetical protein [Acinetobacter ursingii]
MEWFFCIFIAVIIFFVWFSRAKKQHINFSNKTLISMQDWYSIAKHSDDKDRLNMCKHIIVESAYLLNKSKFLTDEKISKIIDIKDFNAANFVNNILADTTSIRIGAEHQKELNNFDKPAREYFAIAIIAIVESSFSKDSGLERIFNISLNSCGTDVKWK